MLDTSGGPDTEGVFLIVCVPPMVWLMVLVVFAGVVLLNVMF